MTSLSDSAPLYPRGIRVNLHQFILQAIQVFFVGLMIGMERNVLPVLSEQFGVGKGSFLYLLSFLVSFGLVKGALNFVAGRLSERIGRKPVLLLGWLAALPIPFMILLADNWLWIIAANLFLGLNQGFAWSMTVTSKVDITHAGQRGFATGVNEFAGYAAVGIGGLLTGYFAQFHGARVTLFWFALATIASASLLALIFIRETLPWARSEHSERLRDAGANVATPFPGPGSNHLRAGEVFRLVSFIHPTFRSLCQAGIANKIADALMWGLFPVFLHEHGLGLMQIGWITATYGMVWGASQLLTGALSDRIGRKLPVAGGLWLLGASVAAIPLFHGMTAWSVCAVAAGFGMALLYPNLIAAMADLAPPQWRSSALGTYRYWRDTGYAIGGLLLGGVAEQGHGTTLAFYVTAAILAISGWIVWTQAEETHPARPG